VGRPRVRKIFPIALSLSAAATAMDLPLAHIKRAVASGALVAREGPGRRIRCTVLDLTEWWAVEHPRVTEQRSQSHERRA
jgi:hypothetical protein